VRCWLNLHDEWQISRPYTSLESLEKVGSNKFLHVLGPNQDNSRGLKFPLIRAGATGAAQSSWGTTTFDFSRHCGRATLALRQASHFLHPLRHRH
jgi:hypothetical protein